MLCFFRSAFNLKSIFFTSCQHIMENNLNNIIPKRYNLYIPYWYSLRCNRNYFLFTAISARRAPQKTTVKLIIPYSSMFGILKHSQGISVLGVFISKMNMYRNANADRGNPIFKIKEAKLQRGEIFILFLNNMYLLFLSDFFRQNNYTTQVTACHW